MENMRDLNELVEAMDQAHFRLATGAPYTRLQTNIDGMTAALRVAEPVIEQRRDGQWEKAYTEEAESRGDTTANLPAIRARITAKKTPEERVTVKLIKQSIGHSMNEVFLDGVSQDVQFLDSVPAEIYRLGLIAKLRESEESK